MMHSATAPQAYAERSISVLDDKGPYGGSYSGDAFNSSMDTDNVPAEREPVFSG